MLGLSIYVGNWQHRYENGSIEVTTEVVHEQVLVHFLYTINKRQNKSRVWVAVDVAMAPTYLAHYLNVKDVLYKSSPKSSSFANNFPRNLFKEKQLYLLAQPVCTCKWHQFPTWKSAHPGTWEPPSIFIISLDSVYLLFSSSNYFRKETVITLFRLHRALSDSWNGIMSKFLRSA